MKRVGGVFLIGLGVWLHGCGMLQPSPEQQRQTVKERSEARWASVLKRDWEAAYAFLTPATRQGMDVQAFSRRGNLRIYRAAAVRDVECKSAEACTVNLDVTYATRIGMVTTPLSETWVKVGWGWYYVLQD